MREGVTHMGERQTKKHFSYQKKGITHTVPKQNKSIHTNTQRECSLPLCLPLSLSLPLSLPLSLYASSGCVTNVVLG